jgi:hypothetical protein
VHRQGLLETNLSDFSPMQNAIGVPAIGLKFNKGDRSSLDGLSQSPPSHCIDEA